MGIKDTFKTIFGNKISLKSCEIEGNMKFESVLMAQYAQHIVAERYGALLSKCEFKTYVKNALSKGENYYLMNVQPNPNQSSSEFWKMVANKLICELECLIIVTDEGYWYVADTFEKGDYQIKETHFKNVTVNLYEDNSYQLTGEWYGDKAIYIKYSNVGAKKLINSVSSMYSELIDNVKKTGSNKLKYGLFIDSTKLNGIDINLNEEIKRIVNEDFNKLVNDGNVIMPLFNGFDLKVLNPANNNAQNSTTASSNINNMFEATLIHIGQLYNVPLSVMKGTYEENDMDDFLTFGLDPLADLIEEAINRKHYGKANFYKGTYCSVDTKKIKHFDILTVSNAINKLISSGVYTINELRTILDEKPISEDIGDLHWITRNYAVVGDYVQEQSNYSSNGSKNNTNGGDDEQDEQD